MEKQKGLPFPEITTPRLRLRKLTAQDATDIFTLRSDASVGKYLSRPQTRNLVEAANFIEKINAGIDRDNWFYWALSSKEDSAFLGTICLWQFSDDGRKAETGYEILPKHQGKGYMREALNAILEYAFERLKLQTVEAYTHKENAASTRLLEKCGFRLTPQTAENNNVVYACHKKGRRLTNEN